MNETITGLYKTAKTNNAKGSIPANTYVSLKWNTELYAYQATDAQGNHELYYGHELHDFCL